MKNIQQKTVTISEEEYMELMKHKKVDKELLAEIARGIKDILQGKVEEI